MSPKRIGPLAQAWYKWKALRLPWRKRFLVGFDLNGNTFWEFRLTNNAEERWRRIVKYPRSTHLSQVEVTPSWHQWLRYTRDNPPSLEEQRQDVSRRARMKQLAAQADARWEAKPRLVEDAPEPARLAPRRALQEKEKVPVEDDAVAEADAAHEAKKQAFDPWAQHRSQGPGEKWQPTAWNPSKSKAP